MFGIAADHDHRVVAHDPTACPSGPNPSDLIDPPGVSHRMYPDTRGQYRHIRHGGYVEG